MAVLVIAEIVANRIKEVLKHNGVTAMGYATKLLMPQSTLASQLSGRGLSLTTIISVLNDFNVSADWLLLGVGSMERKDGANVDNSVNLLASANSGNVTQVNGARSAEVEVLRSKCDMLKNENERLIKDNERLWGLLSKSL